MRVLQAKLQKLQIMYNKLQLKPRQVARRLFVLAALLFMLLGLRAAPVSAATITVCASGCDHTTIAAAITAATAGDMISLSAETFTEAALIVDKELTITGDSAATTIVQAHATAGSATDRVFTINSGVTATFENLTIRHGQTSGGGGIRNQGTLTINTSTISNNTATGSSGNGGGGILNNGTLTINNSTFSGNDCTGAASGGGAIRNGGTLTANNSTFSGNSASGSTNTGGGAIRNDATAEINNSTFSGNSASASNTFGGAIINLGTATIRNSTLSDNTTGSGYNDGALTNYNATLNLFNTIIANSTGISCSSNNTLATDTNNLIEGTNSGCGTPVSTADPNLAALADNGGDTQTLALQMGSPAIDAGDNTSCAAAPINNFDQRNAARAGGVGSGGNTCDIGAYEYDSPALAVTLASLQALATGEHVVVRWETVSELENLGFKLYRATELSGAQEQLNGSLIAAQAPGSGQGAAYEYVDEQVAAGMTYYYWLADVDVDGSETLHGPISATVNAPTAITLDSLQNTSTTPLWALLSLTFALLVGGAMLRRRNKEW